MNYATVFIGLILVGALGVAIGASSTSQPEMNTICNNFHSEVKIVKSYIDGKVVPLEITEYVCDDFEMRK